MMRSGVQAETGPRRAELEGVERALLERDVLAAATRTEEVLGTAVEDHRKRVEVAKESSRRAEDAGRRAADAEAARAAVEGEVARTRPELDEAKRLDAELVPRGAARWRRDSCVPCEGPLPELIIMTGAWSWFVP